jgi:uridine kinase
MEKIFVNYSLDKRLMSRIYKELQKVNNRRTDDTINKWENELNSSQKK